MILMGSQIGNNVIVGAGSVVSARVPDNVVVAGNPAKLIRTLDKQHQVRKERTPKEAIEYAKTFYEFNGRVPPSKSWTRFIHYFWSVILTRLSAKNREFHKNSMFFPLKALIIGKKSENANVVPK